MKRWNVYFTHFFGGVLIEDFFAVYAMNETEAEKIGQDTIEDHYPNARLRRVELA